MMNLFFAKSSIKDTFKVITFINYIQNIEEKGKAVTDGPLSKICFMNSYGHDSMYAEPVSSKDNHETPMGYQLTIKKSNSTYITGNAHHLSSKITIREEGSLDINHISRYNSSPQHDLTNNKISDRDINKSVDPNIIYKTIINNLNCIDDIDNLNISKPRYNYRIKSSFGMNEKSQKSNGFNYMKTTNSSSRRNNQDKYIPNVKLPKAFLESKIVMCDYDVIDNSDGNLHGFSNNVYTPFEEPNLEEFDSSNLLSSKIKSKGILYEKKVRL